MNKNEVARFIDSTLLKADASENEILALCNEAKENGFRTVCLNPCWVKKAHQILEGSSTGVCTVIGFPLGANTPAVKAFEAKNAVLDGADEVDMVINIGWLKSNRIEDVTNDIRLVKSAIGSHTLKVIIECCLLTDEEKKTACLCAKNAGADFVKTSTGFSKWGAKAEDVKLMRETVGSSMHVKAAGGVRNYEELVDMVNAGADRIGTSHGKDILDSIVEK